MDEIRKNSSFTFDVTEGERLVPSLKPRDFGTILLIEKGKDKHSDLMEATGGIVGNEVYRFLGHYWNGKTPSSASYK